MWIVEINFAGRQFTHDVHARRRPIFHFSPRILQLAPVAAARSARGLIARLEVCSVHRDQDPDQTRLDAYQDVGQRRRGDA